MTAVAAATASRPGRGADQSDDAAVVDAARGLAAVADAIGAGAPGVAQLACRSWLAAAVGAAAGADRMGAGLAAAEAALRSGGRPVSFAAVAIDPARRSIDVAHAGAVRVYVLRRAAPWIEPAAPRWAPIAAAPSGAQLVCVTRDHGTVAAMVEQGVIDRAAGRRHPLRARLTRALGAGVACDRARVALGDRVLIVSNGVWEAVDDGELAAIVDEAGDPAAACAAVIAAIGRASPDDAIAAALFVEAIADAREAREPTQLAIPAAATPLLDRLGRDLGAAARAGRLEPVIGRDAELARLQLALLSRRKPNALVVGEPGVGKSCLVEALAQAAARPGAPPELARLRVIELAAGALVGGTRLRGELEERVTRIVAEAEAAPHVVLFLDELHALVGAGGDGVDVMDLLKPALARGGLRVIGATTPAELEPIARDEALLRRFEIIRLDEPSEGDARRMLAGARPRLEEHFGVAFTDDALAAAVELTVRHVPDRRLPDKAIDVLEHAGARRLLAGARAPIEKADVAVALAERTGLPLDRIEPDAAGRRARVIAALREELVGQDDAIARIADAIARDAPRGPRASLLLVGPTGVGKTAAARLLADALYGPGRLVRFDLGEYGDEHQVARLLGAPPGYVGHDRPGALIEALRTRPGAVVLFDELEKAHASVHDVLLGVLDDGRVTDGGGRVAHLGEAIVVLTSNLLAGEPPRRAAGFAASPATAPTDDAALRAALRAQLPAELIGRIGAVIAFASPDAAAKGELVRRRLARHAAGRGSVAARALDGVPAALAARIADGATSPRELVRLADDAALARLAGVGSIDTLRPEARRVVSLVIAPRLEPPALVRVAVGAGVAALVIAPAAPGALAAVAGGAEALVLARAAAAAGALAIVDRGRVGHGDGGALTGLALDRARALADRLAGRRGAFLTDDAAAALPPDERARLARVADPQLSVWTCS